MIRAVKTTFISSILILLNACLCAAAEGSSQVKASQLFEVGEVLEYKLKWSFINVGTAKLMVLKPELKNERECSHFNLSIQTGKWVDKFYKVRTDVHSWMRPDLSRTEHYIKKQLEGKTHRDIDVAFNWDKKEAVYQNWGEALDPIELPDIVVDPLSIMYYFRTLDVKKGGEYQVPVTDGKKVVNALIRVTKREKVKTPLGRYDCFKVEPDIKDLGGIFKKSKKASLILWLTADEKRYPVKMSSKVKVGSFTAYVTSIKNDKEIDHEEI